MVLLGLVCGCNPVFDIDKTDLIDPPIPVDAPPDAPPPMCPAYGGLPRFRNELYRVPNTSRCTGFGVSADQSVAAAICIPDPYTGILRPATGTVTDGLTTQAMSPDSVWGMYQFRMGAENDFMVAKTWIDNVGYRLRNYKLDASGWTAVSDPFMPTDLAPGYEYSLEYSNPTRGPNPRMIAIYMDSSYVEQLVEFAWDGMGWQENQREALAAVRPTEITYVEHPMLSADGLRLLFNASQTVSAPTGSGSATTGSGSNGTGGGDQPIVYLDRPTTNDKFSLARVLDTIPNGVTWPHLSEDCSRLYMYALDQVWYLEYAYE